MSDKSYYYDTMSEDGSMLWFEAHGPTPANMYTEGKPLAYCEYPVPGPVTRRHLDGAHDCPFHAVAKIQWANGDEMKVCMEHYEQIRTDFEGMVE